MTDNNTGTFVWRELMTPDARKSAGFYGELFGWKIKAVEMGGGATYHLIHKKDDQDQGGIMKVDRPGIPPHWVSYVKVDDVDATLTLVEKSGGKALHAATDIPNVGRFAVAGDPEGAIFVLYRSKSPSPAPANAPRPAAGEFCWETLAVSSIEKATAFYGAVFGWTGKPSPDGKGLVFLKGETMVADVLQAQPGMPSSWLTYVVVDDLAAANARATKLGGSVLMPKVEVPNMGSFSVVKDDLGAVIGLFQSA